MKTFHFLSRILRQPAQNWSESFEEVTKQTIITKKQPIDLIYKRIMVGVFQALRAWQMYVT